MTLLELAKEWPDVTIEFRQGFFGYHFQVVHAGYFFTVTFQDRLPESDIVMMLDQWIGWEGRWTPGKAPKRRDHVNR